MTARRATSLLLVVGVLLAGVAVPVGPALAADDTAEFEPTIVHVRQGETADVGISVPEGANDSYRLSVGSQADGFLARATVRDADGDGSVTVEVDTATAGDGDPDGYLAVSDGDALRNATQVEPAGDLGQPLEPGAYNMNLTSDGEAVAIGTLSIAGSDGGTGTTDESAAGGEETTSLGDTGTSLDYDGNAITLQNASGQTVRGETTLDAGAEVVVRLQSSRHNFLISQQVSVSESGTFTATFDMSGVAADATFQATVLREGTTLAHADGRVVGCSSACDRATTTDETGESTTTQSPDEVTVQRLVEVTRTKTANVPLTFGDAEALTVAIGGDSVNYVVVATVRDDDDDGRADVRFHTESAGFDAPTLASDDELELKSETSISSTLDAGSYPVRVYRGENVSGESAATGRLVVYEAAAPAPGETTDRPSNTTETTASNEVERTPVTDADSGDRLLGGFGAIAIGGVLAVVGIGVLLGLFRR